MIRLNGLPVSEGIGIGPSQSDSSVAGSLEPTLDASSEQLRFDKALAMAVEQVSGMRNVAVDDERKDILDAHLSMIEDPELAEDVAKRISSGDSAQNAVEGAVEAIAVMFESLQDEYLRARAADIRDIKDRLIRNLAGVQREITPGCIYIVEELFPSTVPTLADVAGVVSEKGGGTSHAAILIRASGIPAVFGVENITQLAASGTSVIVDGFAGDVIIDPDQETLENYKHRMTESTDSAREAIISLLNGEKLLIKANISSVDESADIARLGADGIGVVRTEFLFDGRDTEPTEDEQFEAYSSIVKNAAGLPVVIRTLDAGSDKPLAFVPIPVEPNPALGLRGLRVSLAQPKLFKTQLRAILRAAQFGPVTIMYPMVTNPDELTKAAALLDEARSELQARDIQPGKVLIGAMIEVPSAALRAVEIAQLVDYMSIGTNDLTQYTLATDRINNSVAALYEETNPAVLELIRLTNKAGKAKAIQVGVCGEMASKPAALIELIKLGIREISVSVPFIKKLKELVI